jgi:hypothetical protein
MQVPLGDEEAEWVDRRQSVARGSSDDCGTVLDGDRFRCREKAAVGLGSKCVDAGLNVGGVAHANRRQFHRELGSGLLERVIEFLPGRAEFAPAEDEGRPLDTWRDLFEHLQPLCCGREFECGKTGDVATRARETRDQAAANWVGKVYEDDWDGCSFLP